LWCSHKMSQICWHIFVATVCYSGQHLKLSTAVRHLEFKVDLSKNMVCLNVDNVVAPYLSSYVLW
jgi:hypothetical protein